MMQFGHSSPVQVVIRPKPVSKSKEDICSYDEASNTVSIETKEKPGIKETKSDSAVKLEPLKCSLGKILRDKTQGEFYNDAVAPLVSQVMEGFNGTIISYGINGSGKTFTMTGQSSNCKQRGVIPRSISDIFRTIETRPDTDFVCTLSCFEIFNERIIDLMNETRTEEPVIVEDPRSHCTVIKGLKTVEVKSEESALSCLFTGDERRTVSKSKLGYNSHRSHCILTITIQQKPKIRGSESILVSKLTFVDLGGFSKISVISDSSKPDNKDIREALSVNRSLSYLEECIKAVASKSRQHIPFRQSKLTNALKDSLGGNSLVLMVVCLWGEPQYHDEAVASLIFANQFARMKNVVTINYDIDPFEQLKKYEKEVSILKQDLMLHNELAGKVNIPRIVYTPEEREEIAKKLQEFVVCPPEQEDSILPIEGVTMMKELLQQIKSLCKETLALHPLKPSELPSEDHEEAEFALDESNEGDEARKPRDCVGELGMTGGIGRAPANARPSSLMFESKESSDEEATDARGIAGPPKMLESTEREEAFEYFKKTAGLGLDLNNDVNRARNSVHECKLRMKETIERVNGCKAQIEESRSVFESMKSRPDVSRDELNEQKSKHKEIKMLYVNFFQSYTEEKEKLAELERKCQIFRSRLLNAFDVWCESTGGLVPRDSGDDEGKSSDSPLHGFVGSVDAGSPSFMAALKKGKETPMN